MAKTYAVHNVLRMVLKMSGSYVNVILVCIVIYLYRFYGVFGQYTEQRAYD